MRRLRGLILVLMTAASLTAAFAPSAHATACRPILQDPTAFPYCLRP
jgi:hypothetical protein